MSQGYAITHQGRVWTPTGEQTGTIQDVDAHNAEVERRELEAWTRKPDQGVAYFVFPHEKGGGAWRRAFRPTITGSRVMTWRGAKLGAIIDAKVYTNNFGARVVTVRANIGGAIYHGRASWDGGNGIRLRKGKEGRS